MCIDRLSQYQNKNADRKIAYSRYICICVLVTGTYVDIVHLCYLCFCGIFFAINLEPSLNKGIYSK